MFKSFSLFLCCFFRSTHWYCPTKLDCLHVSVAIKISHLCACECWFVIRHAYTRTYAHPQLLWFVLKYSSFPMWEQTPRGKKVAFCGEPLHPRSTLSWHGKYLRLWCHGRSSQSSSGRRRHPPWRRKCHSVELQGNFSLWCDLIHTLLAPSPESVLSLTFIYIFLTL